MKLSRPNLTTFLVNAHSVFSRMALITVSALVLMGSTGCMKINSQRLVINDQDLAIPKALQVGKIFNFRVTGKESMGDQLTLERIGTSKKFIASLITKNEKSATPVVEKFEVFFQKLKNTAQAKIKINYLLVVKGRPDNTAETFILGAYDSSEDPGSKPGELEYFAVRVGGDDAPKRLKQLMYNHGLDSHSNGEKKGKLTTARLGKLFSTPIVLKHLEKGIVTGVLHRQ